MAKRAIAWAFGVGILLTAGLLLASAAGAEDAAASSTAVRVRADLERFILERVEGEPSSIEIPELRGFDFDTSGTTGEVRTELSTRSPSPLQGRVAISVSLYVGRSLVKRGVVSPYVTMSERVVIAKHALSRGHVVAAEDLASVERDRAKSPGDVARDPALLVGQRARRSVAPDQVLREGDFERVPVVERGDRVTLVLQHGPLSIQALGRAQETGSAGDWIRVVNVESKREVSGRVDSEGRVHVAF
ncbi:flagellar basal body P-ring formation chaperone FlgA [Myxococcota bacterium]|nr:flagellar basal body P-ring formation chaperone FlgA [Myxococcota bacterium]